MIGSVKLSLISHRNHQVQYFTELIYEYVVVSHEAVLVSVVLSRSLHDGFIPCYHMP